ncbi:MAG: hemerythrin domain-containing protein [Candidatus Thorarchaeota archaeon]
MMPIGPLMIEHRLIERMIGLMREELGRIRDTTRVNSRFIDTAVDFLRTYADRTHHGKEEDILFRELSKKSLTAKHQKIMDELVDEHIIARKTVGRLIEANTKYMQGDNKAVDEILRLLEKLVNFYPEHIRKEDKDFFIPCMDYFSQQEQQDMLNEFWEFDRKMIHEKYKKVIENLTPK